MVDKRNSPTYQAQKTLNDPTAWRSIENKYFTSSSLAGISLKQLDLRRAKNVADELFNNQDSSEFFSGIQTAITDIFDLINQDSVEQDLRTINNEIFDYKAVVDFVAISIQGAKSQLNPSLYRSASEKVKQLLDIVQSIIRSSGRDLREKVNIVNSQVESVEILNGGAGRKIASGLINSFLSLNESRAVDEIEVMKTIAAELYPTGSLGRELIREAPSLLENPLTILQTATQDFCDNTETQQESVKTKLNPLFSVLNTASRFVPNNITEDLKNIVSQVTGIADVVDRGLSAIKSDGGQLQPLAGQFGNESGVRVSTQQFKVPSQITLESFASGRPAVFGNGSNSTIPTIFAQSAKSHPRLFTSFKHQSISGSERVVAPELLNPRLEVVDSYRKYPALALLNPEIANGPSLTSAVREPVIDTIIGNRNTGTTVGDIDNVLKTSEQIVIPRIG